MHDALKPFVTTIDHVGIAVADLDAAISFYAETFGMEARHIEVNDDQGVHEAMLYAHGDESGPALQLMAPLREDSAVAKFLDKKGPGLQQLAYRVTDVEHASAVLRDKGFRLIFEQPRRGTSNSKVNFVHPKDMGGVLVELVEPAPQ